MSPEERVPRNHPLRIIRGMVDTVLNERSPRFAVLYSHTGRPSDGPGEVAARMAVARALDRA
jgi:transposase